MSRRFHIFIDAENVDPKYLDDDKALVVFTECLADLIEMKIIDGPRVVQGQPYNPGLTVKTVIDFSSIDIHTFTDTGEFCLDIFSCKKFDYKLALEYVKDCFDLKDKDIHCGVARYGGIG
jgi:S-adenosylmethionine/arginine decarboxylase-like enzyme